MDWYKWAFDGIGGATFLAICGYIYRKYALHRMRKSSKSTQIDVINSLPHVIQEHHYHSTPMSNIELKNSDPTPLQIWKEINCALPFDRDHAAYKYRGLEVLWHLRFQSVNKLERKWLFINYFEPNSEEEDDKCTISFSFTSVPANLKTAPQDSLLWIHGKIKYVEGHITLDDDPTIIRVDRANKSDQDVKP